MMNKLVLLQTTGGPSFSAKSVARVKNIIGKKKLMLARRRELWDCGAPKIGFTPRAPQRRVASILSH